MDNNNNNNHHHSHSSHNNNNNNHSSNNNMNNNSTITTIIVIYGCLVRFLVLSPPGPTRARTESNYKAFHLGTAHRPLS